MKPLYLYIILLYTVNTAMAQGKDGQALSRGILKRNTPARMHSKGDTLNSLICYPGLPYAHHKKIYQDLFIKNGGNKIKTVTIACFDVTGQDTIQVSSVSIKGRKLRRKKSYININMDSGGDSVTVHSLYKKIISGNKGLPAGEYRIHLTVQYRDSVARKEYGRTVDSMLSAGSGAHQLFDRTFSAHGNKSFLGFSSPRKQSPSRNNTPLVLKKSSRKIETALRAKGFDVSYRDLEGKKLADVYCRERYIGYYEIDLAEPIADKINERKARLNHNLTAGVNTGLGNNKPVFSQLKELNREKNDREVTGNISLTGNMASGQEEYSQQENNFYEVTGQMEISILNVPVLFEGYYTSQDKSRIAKASYFRLHYDSEQAKSQLMSLVSGYKNKYNRASSAGKSYQNIYGTYMGRASGEKDKLWGELAMETGLADPGKFKADTSGLYEAILSAGEKKMSTLPGNPADSIGAAEKALEARQAATERYRKAAEKYRRIRELEEKVQHYKNLLAQYRENNYYDSLMAYESLKDLDYGSMDDKSYRQLSKAAGSLLPPGDNKKFISGLKSLDAGIFSKQVSAYTINGQTIKGVDVAYDLGVIETGFTYGRIEYVSRDGFLDKYSGYSGRVSFKPARGHRTGIIYYGYTPGRRMLNEDAFFKDVDVYMPSFKNNPVHILSLTHQGEINRNIKLAAEAATSYRNFDEFSKGDMNTAEKMSWRMDVEGSVPQTAIDLKGGYEHVGKQFENNTLPLNLSGTDRYSAGATGRFLKNFLTLGIQYNYLVQQNFSSRSAHSKWGFEIKTSSKRYPSASLSYKPFTTFRSFADTLNLPQRPILGEVWLGKLTYQLKKEDYALRLTAIYNRNTALVDTMESNSNVAQLNAIYTRGKLNLLLGAGQTRVNASSLSPVHGTTNFVTVAASYNINTQWNLSLGQDVGTQKSGLSRYGANLGVGYRFKNAPLSVRTGFRYNSYRVSEVQAWKNIYAGLLDINWQFRFKMNERI